jgi:hypothetical protein
MKAQYFDIETRSFVTKEISEMSNEQLVSAHFRASDLGNGRNEVAPEVAPIEAELLARLSGEGIIRQYPWGKITAGKFLLFT